MKKVLTIAGSDSCGGAGIQTDLKTFAACGVYGMSVITAITAQNTMGVNCVENVSEEMVKAQIDAIFEDIKVDSIKIGMLSNENAMEIIANMIKKYDCKNVVLDPVMISTSGFDLIDENSREKLIFELLPMATIITPNLSEAKCIYDLLLKKDIVSKKIDEIRTVETMIEVGKSISIFTKNNVLVKGGHLKAEPCDVLVDREGNVHTFRNERINTKNTHGTGCTLSSAIAAFIAKGYSVNESVKMAKKFITNAIYNSLDIGKGCGPTNPMGEIYKIVELEAEESEYSMYLVTDEKSCNGKDFYKCIDESIKGGVKVVQLREKNMSTREFYERALKLKDICKKNKVPLLINDRIDIALAVDADGIHLGQSDMDISKARELLGNDKIIGISAKTIEEALEAQKNGADYIGIGAVFATSTKKDTKIVELSVVEEVKKRLHIPVLAIGGISVNNVDKLSNTNVDGICVISDILNSDDCRKRTSELVEKFREMKRNKINKDI